MRYLSRYPVPHGGPCLLSLPQSAELLSIQILPWTQQLVLYALVDLALPLEPIQILCCHTWHELEVPVGREARYLGTCSSDAGLVWHGFHLSRREH
jgi:hypothetical protein